MDVISLVIFLIILILGFWRKVNVGVLSFGIALILGRIIGLQDKEVVKMLSSKLFLTLTGITLLFSAVNLTGALDMISKKIVSAIGKRVWVLPIVAYLLGFILAVIGPGAIPPTALVATITVSIAVSTGYNPLMMGVLGGLGLMGGRCAALTPEGAIVANFAAEQGLDNSVIAPVLVFQIICTVLAAVGVFLFYKGYKVKGQKFDFGAEKVHITKQQVIGLLAIVVMLIMVVVFGFDIGLSSFLIAGVLFIFKVVDDREAIKGVPWGTISMILGVGVLLSVIQKAGGIDLLCNTLSGIMFPGTVAPLTGITAGIMSLVSSGLGVVYPTLLPMASDLVASVGGGQPVAVMAAVVAGGSLAGFSPMSTCGALTLASMAALKPDMSKEEQNKSFVQLIIIAVCFILWVGICSAIFGNLCVSLFS